MQIPVIAIVCCAHCLYMLSVVSLIVVVILTSLLNVQRFAQAQQCSWKPFWCPTSSVIITVWELCKCYVIDFSNRWWQLSSTWHRTLSAATTSMFWCRLVSLELVCREAKTLPAHVTSLPCSGWSSPLLFQHWIDTYLGHVNGWATEITFHRIRLPVCVCTQWAFNANSCKMVKGYCLIVEWR